MKIQYLGTAAAEGIPAIFCDCETCRKSAKLGGKNIRTRSQAIVDERLLVDFPADTYMHFLMHNVPLCKIENCLITHSHSDHLYVNDIQMRMNGNFAHLSDTQAPLTFYSDLSGYKLISDTIEKYGIHENDVRAVLIKPFEPFVVDAYQVTALKASHDPDSSPVVYLIEKEGKTLFHANDTGEFCNESMNYLENMGKRIDLVSFDCTDACSQSDYYGHLSFERCIALRERFTAIGVADDNTVFVLNHFSHNGENVIYNEFSKKAEKSGFLTSYDGMIVEF